MVLVLHGAVIALALFSHTTAPAAASPGLVAFNVTADRPQEPHAASSAHTLRAAAPVAEKPPIIQPAITLVPVAVPVPLIEMARIDVMASLADMMPITDAAAQEAPGAPGAIQGGCDLTPRVQEALRHSDAILHELPAVPAARRSIANAIVVWNAGWIDPGTGSAQAPLSAIRQTIEQVVAASPADCRSQLQAGPRLIYLPDDAGRTTVLAVGSGQWRWQQLADGAVPSVDGAPVPIPERLPATAMAQVPRPGAADQTPNLNALLASLIGQKSPAAKSYYP